MKHRNKIAVVVLLSMCLGFAPALAEAQELNWLMANVSAKDQQGDAHVIFEQNGKSILLDTGTKKDAESDLIPLLKEKQLFHFDAVFISHPHNDHSSGLIPLLSDPQFSIDRIY